MVTALPGHLGFTRRMSAIQNGVFIPRYYDPEIPNRLEELHATHELVALGDLQKRGLLATDTGNEIGKLAYGTGEIPFIRTSDIANWELKTDPKQGVSPEIYAEYSSQQDVKPGDIFFVRDGTYLVGQCCLVTAEDVPCIYQSHILKLRVSESAPISAHLLLACLNSPVVKKQIRAKRFTADIIDTVGNRFLELIIPVPRDTSFRSTLAAEVQANVKERAKFRERIRRIPFWAEGLLHSIDQPLPEDWAWRVDLPGNAGFVRRMRDIREGVFIPKYYDPGIEEDVNALSESHDLRSLGDLAASKELSWDTGIEIGKMAYGTGPIPFIRTSDISNWELKGDPKQNISEEIYEEDKQDVQTHDILLVRDGTYLVGTSCILTEHDTRILYCGGIYKLRTREKGKLDPFLLLALLNAPIVRRQMRAKQFTRDIIDTLGKRLFEVVLPIPKDSDLRKRIADETRNVIQTRVRLRNRAREIAYEVEGLRYGEAAEADEDPLAVREESENGGGEDSSVKKRKSREKR